jgi:hydrogenase maturation protein HypF
LISNKTIFAAGADIKNKFLLVQERKFYFGPELGDLGEVANYEKFKAETTGLIKKIKAKLQMVACDLHPGYFSRHFVKENLKEAHKIIEVQHHQAHIASVMAEHELKQPVIGVAFDGTGYGSDGHMWGGEFLLVDGGEFRRLAHLKYQMMPGGDKVVAEPWRMVLSILGEKGIKWLKNVKKQDMDLILGMMAKNINSTLSSSAGRMFDAAAALMGITVYASYEAEGPVKLEAMIDKSIRENYEFKIIKENGCYIIDVKPIFAGLVEDLRRKKDKSILAAKFHNSMVEIILATVKRLAKETGIKDIALSGGVFQNKFLKTNSMEKLKLAGFRVFTNQKYPVNDLNISLGQYYVSSHSG